MQTLSGTFIGYINNNIIIIKDVYYSPDLQKKFVIALEK